MLAKRIIPCLDVKDGVVVKGVKFRGHEVVGEIVPLIASGGAGEPVHFLEAFRDAKVDGALAASVFHKKIINIGDLKNYLRENNIEVRTC